MNTYILTDRYTDRHMQTHTHVPTHCPHDSHTHTRHTRCKRHRHTHRHSTSHHTPPRQALSPPARGWFSPPPRQCEIYIYKYICSARYPMSVQAATLHVGSRRTGFSCTSCRSRLSCGPCHSHRSVRAFRVMGAGLRPAEGTSPSPACMKARKGVWMRLTRPHDAHGQRPVRCEPMWEVPFRGRGTVGERGEDPVASAHCVCLSSRCCPEAEGRTCG